MNRQSFSIVLAAMLFGIASSAQTASARSRTPSLPKQRDGNPDGAWRPAASRGGGEAFLSSLGLQEVKRNTEEEGGVAREAPEEVEKPAPTNPGPVKNWATLPQRDTRLAYPQLEAFREVVPRRTKGDYNEQYRPQFHFTSYGRRINDPNGLVYYDGLYHLYFQHRPNKVGPQMPFWGHAVSKDMLHWTQRPSVFPNSSSGCGVVDVNNTSGFGKDGKTPIVMFRGNHTFRSGLEMRFAYSLDATKSWTEYDVTPWMHEFCDPAVFWYEPDKNWVMINFTFPRDRYTYHFFTSKDLKNWTERSTFKAKHSECPDMFELPIDAQNLPDYQGKTKWVFHFGSGRYFIGEFDGKTFTKEEGLYQLDYGQFYASQTWKNVPRLKSGEQRTIQVAWVIGSGIRGMPFSDQFTFPCELSLQNCPEGLRVCRTPIREINNLYQRTHSWENVLLSDTNLLETIRGELFDMEAEFDFGDAEELTLNIRNHPMVISAKDRFIAFNGKKMPIAVVDNRVKVRILIDRASVEVFANQGQSVLTRIFTPKAEERSLVLTAKTPEEGRPVKVLTMQVHPLNSTWRK